MRRVLALAVLTCLMIGFAPVWTARWVEAQRKRALAEASHSTAFTSACPADDSFFGFLDSHQKPLQGAPSLWRPLCHKAQPPMGKIAVLTDRVESFRRCVDEISLHRATAAHCWLDPQVAFLADDKAGRTFARISMTNAQGREVLWATAVPLAWNAHLESEHRMWMTLACLLTMLLYSLRLSRRRWMVAGCLQREIGGSNTLPPAGAERLLLFFLPSFNYPQEADDLREANRWYRWQVRQSLFFYLGQRLSSLHRSCAKRTSTGGG